ncbi:MAG: esterase-like activity of phytase family protein [Azospirillum sp.]|nr:esterase-like activity of phytase family protein [Azospirillum sp.]
MAREPLILRRRALPALVLGIVLAGCSAIAGDRADISRPVMLAPDQPALATVGRLGFRGGIELPRSHPELGGLSDLALLDHGRQFVAITDHGAVVTGRLRYDARGWLAGAAELSVRRLVEVDGGAVSGKRHDAESLARLPDGGWVVGFERVHRLLRYPPGLGRPDRRPVVLEPPPGLDQAPYNGGIEALAGFADGSLLAIEEGDDDGSTEHRAWIRAPGGAWATLVYRAERSYRPTGAAVMPDGTVLVLERHFGWFDGWAARLVRVAGGSIRPGALLVGEELARLAPPLAADNFEGVAVGRGPDGEFRIALISDDNFRSEQRTLLLMFALPP